jgi:hypothetical protein
MAGPTLDATAEPGVEYLEAIALLQDEVARLEQELRSRYERPAAADPPGTPQEGDPDRDAAELAGARAAVEQLRLELAGRDETIGVLLDQLSRVEEAEAASRAEWEHLAGWLAELEHRVEGQDGDATQQLEDLRAENRWLRIALEESKKPHESGPPAAPDSRLAEALAERDDIRRQLERIEDERRRERHEHTAALVELQAQLSRAALARPDEGKPPVREAPERNTGDREVDLRIRALREHLLEIHQREADARKQKQLLTRLSRLWNRTGPR